MRIIVLGAAGRTGRHIVEQAVRAGHQVTAAVHDPTTYHPPAGPVEVRHADALRPATMRELFDRVDAVINAIGPRNGKEPHHIYSQGTAAVTEQMRRANVRRLVTISAVPASLPQEKNPFERYLLHPILWRFFGPSYADLRLMEHALRDGDDIDWTVVRPPLLTDDTPTGSYRSAIDSHLERARKISRADLATAILDAADDDSLIGHVVTVSA